ncbi:MAG: hypothetical protein AB7O80_18310 [Acetobacteraceae bacterium]
MTLPFSQELVRALGATTVDDVTMTDEERLTRWQSAHDALLSFVPAEPTEAMLAAQAIAAHVTAMECLRRAMLHQQAEKVRIRLRDNAVAMMRAFAVALRSLERHRGWAAGKTIYRD